jgi:hypothetical protein
MPIDAWACLVMCLPGVAGLVILIKRGFDHVGR